MLLKEQKFQRKIIRCIVNKACNKLNIAPIPVKFNNNNNIYADVDKENQHISIDLIRLIIEVQIKNNQSEEIFKHVKRISSIKKRIKFILFHEVAHIYQCRKYEKSFELNFKKQRSLQLGKYNYADYRKFPLENKADKIALSLINTGGI